MRAPLTAATRRARRRFNLLALLASTASVVLILTHHHEAGLTVLISFVAYSGLLEVWQWSDRRRNRRDRTAVTYQTSNTQHISEAVKLWHSPEKVWSLIHPPENAPLLSEDITKGYLVPGHLKVWANSRRSYTCLARQ